MRAVIACVLAGCGRIAFDSHDATATDGATSDGTSALPLGHLAFPDGGSIYGFAFDPNGPTRYALTNRAIYHATDAFVWTACGELIPHAVGVDSAGMPYAASGNDVYTSHDGCATWQVIPGGHYTNGFAANGTRMLALTDTGVYVLPAWTLLSTPFDGDSIYSLAESADTTELVVGSATHGAARSTDTGNNWTPASNGLASLNVLGIAIAPLDRLHAYAIEGDLPAARGEVACSQNGGASWASCYDGGGEAVAVDPLNALHALAAPYDELLETTNGFTSFRTNVRAYDLDDSRVHALAFTAAGVPLVGTDRGVFSATDSALTWVAHQMGLDSWTVQRILVAGADIYAGTYGGMLASRAGGPFTLSTTNMTGNTNTRAMLLTSAPETLFTAGLWIRHSDDHGQTWSEDFQLTTADSYYATSIVQLGSRLIVGSGGRILTSDPPWTIWTPHAVAGASRNVNAVLVHDGAVLAATDTGLFQSSDQGVTYTHIPAVTGMVLRLALAPDDRVLAGTDTTVWLSDAGAAAWQPTAVSGYVWDLAAQGTTIAVALDSGVRVSHDAGATWTAVAGFDTLSPLAVAFEPGGTLLVGADGTGLTRIAAP